MNIKIKDHNYDMGVDATFYPSPEDVYARNISSEVVRLVADRIAERFYEKYGDSILGSISAEDVKAYSKVCVASKVWNEFSELAKNSDPSSRSIPEIAKRTRKELSKILGI